MLKRKKFAEPHGENFALGCNKIPDALDEPPPPMPTTRLADLSNPHDASAIVRLLLQYANDPAIGAPGLGERSKQNVVADLAKRDFVRVFFAVDETLTITDDKHFVGLAICYEMYSTFMAAPTLNVHDFMVDVHWRGRWVGTQLMQAVMDDAKERGCGSVTLEVYEGNTVARATYEKVGFRAPQNDPKLGQTLYLSNRIGDQSTSSPPELL